jgi:hypothetical protein
VALITLLDLLIDLVFTLHRPGEPDAVFTRRLNLQTACFVLAGVAFWLMVVAPLVGAPAPLNPRPGRVANLKPEHLLGSWEATWCEGAPFRLTFTGDGKYHCRFGLTDYEGCWRLEGNTLKLEEWVVGTDLRETYPARYECTFHKVRKGRYDLNRIKGDPLSLLRRLRGDEVLPAPRED